MDKTSKHTKIYILFFLFLLHLISVIVENDLWGNIFSPIVCFYASYIIYISIKSKDKKNQDKTCYFLLGFVLIWGIVDFLWVFTELVLNIDIYETPIPYFYTIPSMILALLAVNLFRKFYKKWDKYQLLIDVVAVCLILIILIWSFVFSATVIEFELSLASFNIVVYMLSDFITLASFIILYFSFKNKTTALSFNIVFLSIIIYVISNLYFIYLDINDLYIANTWIDVSYTLVVSLFALGVYFSKSQPFFEYLTNPSDSIGEDTLPYNYGDKKNIHTVAFISITAFFIPVIGIYNFLMVLVIIAVNKFLNKYIQMSIKTDFLLKKELNISKYLERAVDEKTQELIKANKTLEDISNKDNLTGLYNRRFFFKELHTLIDEDLCKSFALLYMDMDRFKAINDFHGHETGDKVLLSVSHRFKEHCEKHNYMIYRIGGDEFIIIAQDYENEEKLKEFIDELLYIVEKPILLPPYTFSVSVSIGVAKFPQDAQDAESILKYSDLAMYFAKQSKACKRYFFFDSTLSEKIQRKHKLEVMLKNADFDKEFQLYFQPQFRITDKKLVGAEALLRWISPSEGFISPGEFIPIAVETGFIFKLGEWVVEKALNQIKYWNEKYNLDLRIGINVSPLQIENTDFVNKMRETIHYKEINPEWVDFEITEHVAMSTQVSMEEVLSGLASIGVNISIDDFGTGYSSLSYIKRFDIDRLKIAKELIDNIDDDKNTLLIVKAIIMMAKGMGLKTIAEGVEEPNQLELLKHLECDEVQGYIYGRPVPPHEFESMHLN